MEASGRSRRRSGRRLEKRRVGIVLLMVLGADVDTYSCLLGASPALHFVMFHGRSLSHFPLAVRRYLLLAEEAQTHNTL